MNVWISSDDHAGGSPAASYLFCFAKKGNPKKATAQTLPLRGSHEISASAGKRNQLASLRHVSLLYPTGTLLSWQRLKRNSKKTNPKKPCSATATFYKDAGFSVLVLTLP
ncbi:MAG: hypothetical protein ACXU8A_12985, partial [Burkholderiaceae bacterium]